MLLPLAAGAGPSGESLLANEPPELARRLEAQKVLVLEEAGSRSPGEFVIAFVIFARRPKEVVDLVVQSKRQMEYRPELERIETVEDGPTSRVDEHHMKILFQDVAYRLRYDRNPATDRIEWRLDPSFDNDLRRLEGFWEFFPLDGDRTLGRFGSLVDVGPALPAFVQERMTRRTVVRTVENCRKWVDSGGKWRP